MKKALLAAVAALALVLPAQASARIDALDPAGPGTPITAAQAILQDPLQLETAVLGEYAYGGAGAPSPIGVGNQTLDPDPKQLVGFPTFGDTYAILSSGEINEIASNLVNDVSSTTFAFPNQFPLLPSPDRQAANDYTVLSMGVNVPAGANCLSLDYRFLSEEFPEYVNEGFNDAFIAEIGDTTWSVPSGDEIFRPNDFAASTAGQPISVNGVGPTAVSELEAAGTYFDAATGLITTKTPITPGLHSIHFSIFDSGDDLYDSAVFLDDLRFIAESADTCKPPTGAEIVVPPPPTPSAPAPPPSNKFQPGSSVAFGKSKTTATLTINVPGPGVVTAGSTSVGAATATLSRAEAVASAKAKGKSGKGKAKGKGKKKAKPKVKKPLLNNSTVRANQAGPVQITVSLSGTGKAVLAKKGKLTIPVTLTFTPDGGTPASQVQTVTFKKAVAKKCAAKPKGKGKAKGKAKASAKCKKPAKKGKGKKK